MTDEIYGAWRAYQAQLLAALDTADAGVLRKIMRELPYLGDAIAHELVRRDRGTDRQDARLYQRRKP